MLQDRLVARHRVVVGVLNRHSLLGLRWRTTLWSLPGLGSLPLPWGGFVGLAVRLKKENQGVCQ